MSDVDPSQSCSRRTLLRTGLAGTAALAWASGARAGAPAAAGVPAEPRVAGPIPFPDLPYAQDALAPHVSAQTLSFHHGKHHKAYVDNANKMLAGSSLESKSVEEIVRAAAAEKNEPLFNNAAQAWNHAFFWRCMKPKGGGAPGGRIAELLKRDLGGLDGFKQTFADAAKSQFGSGWAWLVLDGEKLAVEKTPNAETPLVRGRKPLLVIDVWEHAYYLDYQNRRADFVTAYLDHLVDWDFASKNL
jgi:Fe-Mn family superoxide dismutase